MPMEEWSDEQLLKRFAEVRDESALAILADRYEASLVGLACAILSGRRSADLTVWADACDIVQEGWVRVIRGAKSFRGDATFKTWIYQIVINLCRNRLRDGRRRFEEKQDGRSDPLQQALPNEDAHAWLVRSDELQELMAAMKALANEKREILILCYHQGMSHPDAAAILGIPRGTLKSRLNTALNELRQMMERSKDKPSRKEAAR